MTIVFKQKLRKTPKKCIISTFSHHKNARNIKKKHQTSAQHKQKAAHIFYKKPNKKSPYKSIIEHLHIYSGILSVFARNSDKTLPICRLSTYLQVFFSQTHSLHPEISPLTRLRRFYSLAAYLPPIPSS